MRERPKLWDGLSGFLRVHGGFVVRENDAASFEGPTFGRGLVWLCLLAGGEVKKKKRRRRGGELEWPACENKNNKNKSRRESQPARREPRAERSRARRKRRGSRSQSGGGAGAKRIVVVVAWPIRPLDAQRRTLRTRTGARRVVNNFRLAAGAKGGLGGQRQRRFSFARLLALL